MLKIHGMRHVRTAALAVAGLCASVAFAAEPAVTARALETAPTGTAPGAVLTSTGVDGRALKLHLAQTLGPESERESQRYRRTIFGEGVQIGVSRGSTLAGPTFAAAIRMTAPPSRAAPRRVRWVC